MKKKSHWIAVKVRFNKAVTKSEAKRLAVECFAGADQYTYSAEIEGPEQMWLSAFRTNAPKEV